MSPRSAIHRFPRALVRLVVIVGAAGGLHGEPAVNASRLEQLRAEVARHDALYFQQAEPEITDAEYDRLKQELRALEQAQPGGGRPEVIPDDRTGRFPTAVHGEPMLSLDKIHTEAEWRRFHADVAREAGRADLAFVVEPKYDGIAISLTYERGRLVRAATRGDGRAGDDVTENVRKIRALPDRLNHEDRNGFPIAVPERVELRGEIYVSDAGLRRLNLLRAQAGAGPFGQARSAAAATLRSLDPPAAATEELLLVIYAWGAWETDGQLSSQRAFHRRVREWGLPGVDRFEVVTSADGGWRAIEQFRQARATLGYPVDGVVLKVDDVDLRRRLGAGTRAPRWAVAFKYQPARTVARIRAITVQVGRTGALTPVAELDPVELDGTTVTRATLHNRALIAERDIRVGDFVEVEKAGEIIPAVVAVRLERRPEQAQPFEFPTRCPACGETVDSKPGGITVRCLNAGCPEQRQRRLEHFASAAAADIPGLGPGAIASLIGSGLVETPADLYRLRREDLERVPGLGPARASQLLTGIERSRRAELWRFIHGLGIPQIGPVNSRRLAESCGGLEQLAEWDEGRLAAVVGAAAGRSAAEFLGRPQNRAELRVLGRCGVTPTPPKSPDAGTRLRGRVLVFTGTLPGLTRSEAVEIVRNAGGIVRDNVTSKTDFLVAGAEPGRKLDEARGLGVEVVAGEEFLRWVRSD